jgi:hypothetical protein
VTVSIERLIWTRIIQFSRQPIGLCFLLFAVMVAVRGSAKAAGLADGASDHEIEDVTILPAFQVKGARVEDFGFRFFGILIIPGTSYVMVSEVFPNTPAAKAGLRPGELILKIDGKSMGIISKMRKLRQMQERKWGELERGARSVTYSLEVRAPGAVTSHTVTMVIPSPAPHWGNEKWNPPEGRIPAVVKESGPLAVLTREVLDNGIWSIVPDSSYFNAPSRDVTPILGYEWRIVQPSGTHRIWVTQQRGKTEILLQHLSQATDSGLFLTSPSGAMEKARCRPSKRERGREIPPEEIRGQFEAEMGFWLTRVGPITGRWPFDGSPVEAESIASSSEGAGESRQAGALLAASFLKLPVATPAERALFFDALGKVGLDEDCWAFTEVSRSFDDNHIVTVRFDPSKRPEERCILLKVDGKVPKAEFLQQWRTEEHEASAGLGEFPALSSIVDVNDVRIYSNETAAIVFELPVKVSNSEFPAGRFQARFRVNKTSRGFEDFAVRLREAMRVAGIAKVTDAGLEARFQAFDPALAPQPVLLKMDGGVRVLFVKLSRAFEVTRTDFKRVVPYQDP